MTDTPPPVENGSNVDPNARWKFIRDVFMFEVKLALNNIHNFFQIPLTIGVALFDLVVRGKEEGERFYKVVEMGRTIDDSIDIYSIIEHRQKSLNKSYTLDAVVSKLEGVIVREVQKGGTAATVKAAVDKAIDELQARTEPASKIGDAVINVADKIHSKVKE
jgi:hypothetical protein